MYGVHVRYNIIIRNYIYFRGRIVKIIIIATVKSWSSAQMSRNYHFRDQNISVGSVRITVLYTRRVILAVRTNSTGSYRPYSRRNLILPRTHNIVTRTRTYKQKYVFVCTPTHELSRLKCLKIATHTVRRCPNK